MTMDLRLGRDDNEPSYWPVLSDLSITILMILVLFLAVNALTSGEAQRQANALHALQAKVASELHAAVPETQLRVASLDAARQRLTFAAELLFPTCQAALRPEGRQMILAVARIVKARGGYLESVEVEGHTDRLPIRDNAECREFPSNWELSSARATSVVRVLSDGDFFPGSKLKAIGRSEYVPSDTTNFAANRRVELVLFYLPAAAVAWMDSLRLPQPTLR